MARCTQTLHNAGALIARYGADVPTHQTRTARDIDATRARVMHTLYVTAHAITVALNAHGKNLVRESRNQGRTLSEGTTGPRPRSEAQRPPSA